MLVGDDGNADPGSTDDNPDRFVNQCEVANSSADVHVIIEFRLRLNHIDHLTKVRQFALQLIALPRSVMVRAENDDRAQKDRLLRKLCASFHESEAVVL